MQQQHFKWTIDYYYKSLGIFQTFRFEAIDRSLSPIDRLKGSGKIILSIA